MVQAAAVPALACVECGVPCAPNRNGGVFCGPRCNGINYSRVNRARRIARIKAASVEAVDPFVVFRRDGWKCRMCGVDTPWRFRGRLYDNAPEVDHIVPLGRGGEHSYANTQCLCRKCNYTKGNRVVVRAARAL